MLVNQLQARKQAHSKWMVSFNDWVKVMGLDSFSVWISGLPTELIQSTMDRALTKLKEARYRDLLLCILTLCLNEKSIYKLSIPWELSGDQSSRMYALELLTKTDNGQNLQSLSCDCYKHGKVFYLEVKVSRILGFTDM